LLQEVPESLEAERPSIGLIEAERRQDLPDAWHAFSGMCGRSAMLQIHPEFNLT
jgi:hypothetical protein